MKICFTPSLYVYICLLFISSLASGQVTVSGTVVDDTSRSGLPGASVLIKGTAIGTTTDLDGNYQLQAKAEDILIFSYVGYTTVEESVGARTTINISLETDTEQLSEVVIIGYGQMEEKDVTGVVSKIDEKLFNKGQLTSPDQLLAGKVAGVSIVSNDGTPGGQSSIRIRGGTSLDASNEPLYVIDGIPINSDAHDPTGMNKGRNPLNFINPSDVADITVLKDASAAAIYGSRGANGVIIITTKRGQSGKLQAAYDGSVAVSFYQNQIRMLTPEEFRFTVTDQSPRNADRLGEAQTDWAAAILQMPTNQNHNLSFSGGTKSTTFRASANYQDINGIIKTSNTKRLAANLNIDQKLFNDGLKIAVVFKYANSRDRFGQNTLGTALAFDPTQPIYTPDDETFGGYFQWNRALAPLNPVARINNTIDIGRTNRYFLSTNLVYDFPFVSGLSLKLNYSYDLTDAERQATTLPVNEVTAPAIDKKNGYFFYEPYKRNSQVADCYFDYVKDIASIKSSVTLTAGYSYQDFFRNHRPYEKSPGVSFAGIGANDPFTYADPSFLNPLIGDSLEVKQFDEFENRLLSYWGRVNFGFQDKYLLTFTLRRDGSTRFAPSNRWGSFPSLAVAWRIGDEAFLKNSSVVSDLKVRLSWGVTGNQEIDDYKYISLYEPGNPRAQYILGSDTVTTYRPGAVDPNIKWEETTSLNLGVDFGFFNGRLTGALDIYQKNTDDLLSDIALPIGTVVGDRALTNVGEIQNSGIELLLNGVIFDKQDFNFNVSFNGAYNKNEIKRLDNQSPEDAAEFFGYQDGNINGNVGQTILIRRVGNPVNAFLVYEHIIKPDGNPVSDQEDYNGDESENNLDVFVDQNADGVINNDDLIIKESADPDFILGLTGNVSYKQFDLAFTLRANIGNYVYNNVFSEYGTFQEINGVVPANIHISAYTNDFAKRSDEMLHSGIYVENASFLRLDNITLGYNTSIIKNTKSRFYITASNLLTITGYEGNDPEAGIFGIDNSLYPRPTTVLFGINFQLN